MFHYEMKKYELINTEGCLFDSIETTSINKAMEYFAESYEGKYIILCKGKRTNIKLLGEI